VAVRVRPAGGVKGLAAVVAVVLLPLPSANAQAPPAPAPPGAGAEQPGAVLADGAEIEALVRDLGADRFDTRERATERLLEIGPLAFPFLQELDTSDDAEVRYRARYILRADLRRVLALLKQLSNSSRAVESSSEAEVMQELLGMGTRAIEPLVQLLRTELARRDPDIGWTVLMLGVVERLGIPEAVEEVTGLLELELRTTHERIAKALSACGEEVALQAVASRVDATDALVRRNAAIVLGFLGAEGSAAPLVQLSDDDDASVRTAALEALVRVGGEEAHAVVRTLLADRDPGVRAAAVEAAGALRVAGTAPVIRELAARAGERDEDLLVAAVNALSRLRDRDATSLFLELLGRKSARVAVAAAEALGRLRVKEAVPGVVALLGRSEPVAQAAALRALGRIGDPQAFDAVTAYYRRRGIYRPLALAAIARFRTDEAKAFLVERARVTEDDTEVHIALDALVHRDEAALAEVALAAIRRTGTAVRARGAHMLGRCGSDERAVAALKELIVDEGSEQVRTSALEALGELGVGGLVELLLERLETESVDVRRQIVRTLARVGKPEMLREEVQRAEQSLQQRVDDDGLRSRVALDLLYLGEYARAEGHLEQVLAVEALDQRILRVAAYNLACARSRSGRADQALAALEKAVTMGFRDWRHMEQDWDLDPIRESRSYRRLLGRMRGVKRTRGSYYIGIPDGLDMDELGDEEAGF
jgi:HEAT repeat protein